MGRLGTVRVKGSRKRGLRPLELFRLDCNDEKADNEYRMRELAEIWIRNKATNRKF